MSREYRVYVINERSGAPTRVQDASRHYDAAQSQPPESAGATIGQGTFTLVNLDSAPDLVVDSLFEVWEGWVNPADDTFDPDLEQAAYFLQEHMGHFEGGVNHQFSCSTADYNLLFDTTPVVTWPTDLEALDPPAGYPPGSSVTDWLVGSTPYPGILPFHFPAGVDFGGVDPIYDTILLDEAHMPTMSNVDSPEEFGMFGFMGLRDLLDEVMKYARLAARDMGLDVRPSYFMRAIVDPTDATALCAQFCCVDLNNQAQTGTVKAVYATDPGPGEWKIGYPLQHTRDARSVQTEVIVMADGDRAEGMTWAGKHSIAGAALYPTRFHRRGYWGGAPILNADLESQTQTDAYAQTVADAIWGPRGQISFDALGPRNLKVGDFVQLNIPAEGQIDHIVPVLRIERDPTPGSTRMHLTVGERTIDIGDILIPRADAAMLSTGQGSNAQGTAAGQWVGGAGATNTPRQRQIVNVATTSKRNVVQGKSNAVVAMTVQQNPTDAPEVGEAPGDPPGDIHVMTRIWDAGDEAWVKTCWTDKWGTPHQQKLAFAWTSDGTVPFAVAERMTIRAAQVPDDPAQAGVTFDIVVNDAGTPTTVATITAGVLSNAFELLPGNQVEIVAGSVPGLASLTLISGDPL